MGYENDVSHVANGEVSAFNKDREIAPRAPAAADHLNLSTRWQLYLNITLTDFLSIEWQLAQLQGQQTV